MVLQKPPKLQVGDTVASISPCHGWAGDSTVIGRYELGVQRLRDEFSLEVIAETEEDRQQTGRARGAGRRTHGLAPAVRTFCFLFDRDKIVVHRLAAVDQRNVHIVACFSRDGVPDGLGVLFRHPFAVHDGDERDLPT